MELIFKNKNFTLLWVSQLISEIGDWLSTLAIPLLVLRLTNSPIAISFYMVSRFLPTMLFSSFTGIIIDRFDRKKILIISDIARVIIFALYPFVTNVYQIFILAFLSTIFSILFGPAKGAMIPNIVGEDKLLEANSLSSSTSSLMRVIGTALGGFFIAIFSLNLTFYLNALTFIISACFIFFIVYKDEKSLQESDEETSLLWNIKNGFSAILNDKALSTLIFMDALSMIGYGFINILLPVYSTKVLTNSESAFGIIMSAFSVGVFMGSVLMKKISQKKSLPLLWCMGLTLAGFSQILFGLSFSLIVAAIFILIAGFGDALQIVSYATLTQKIVPDHLRGRVFSIAGGINSGALLIGMGLTGFLLEIIDARIMVIFSGGLILLSGILSFTVFRNVLYGKKESVVNVQIV